MGVLDHMSEYAWDSAQPQMKIHFGISTLVDIILPNCTFFYRFTTGHINYQVDVVYLKVSLSLTIRKSAALFVIVQKYGLIA